MRAIFDRLVYDTEKSEIIASDAYWDGKNWERKGTNTFLFKTAKGRFFKQFLSANPQEPSYLKPLSESEALTLYSNLKVKTVKFNEAFPNIELQDA